MSLRRFIQRTQMLIQHGLHQTRSAPSLRDTGIQVARLEERLLFSATAVASVAAEAAALLSDAASSIIAEDGSLSDPQLLDLVADSLLPPSSSEQSSENSVEQLNPGQSDARTLELVIVDSSIVDPQSLLDSLRADAAFDDSRTLEFITLDSARDGVAQITSALLRYDGIDGLHILSHGSQGRVQLGSAVLSLETLATYESAISAWKHSLSEQADVLIYGCGMSGDGIVGNALMSKISELTSADVVASEEFTYLPDFSVASNDSFPIEQVSVANVASISVKPARDITLIDLQLDDSADLIAAANPRTTVFMYDSLADSATVLLDRIEAWAVETDSTIATLSILSHGDAGAFALGSDWITTTTLTNTVRDWDSLAAYFSDDARILILGCNVGEASGDGQELIDQLSIITGTDVFASDDITGQGVTGFWNWHRSTVRIHTPRN